MLFFLTFYVFKRVLATYIERKRLEEAVTSCTREKTQDEVEGFFERKKNPEGCYQ